MRVRELAEWLGATFEGDGEKELSGAAPLETAGAFEIAFVGTRKAAAQAESSAAGCLLVPLDWPSPSYRTVIRVPEPRTAFARAMSRFYPTAEIKPGVHPTAVVGKDVEIGAMVYIGPHAVVGDGSRIGVATSIGAGCYVGKRVVLGEGCVLHPNVTVYDNVDIGRGCILHSGAVIGADGFGYVMEHDRWHKFPQVGRVEIGDFVEIGANSCVDRAALGVTEIGEGTKLDNMVHVGAQLPHRKTRGGGRADRLFGRGGGGGLRGDRRPGGNRRQGAHRIAGRAGIGLRRADVEDRALRRNRVGHARPAAEAAPGAACQPGPPAGPAPRNGRFEAAAGRTGEESLMLVVVGGHSRNIGKTSVVAGIIRKLRGRQWTAVKITQYGHGVCSQQERDLRVRGRAGTSLRADARSTNPRTPIPGASWRPARRARSGCALRRENWLGRRPLCARFWTPAKTPSWNPTASWNWYNRTCF